MQTTMNSDVTLQADSGGAALAATKAAWPRARPLTTEQLVEAVDGACLTVGLTDPAAPVWPELVPLVNELADVLDGASGPGTWPPVLACRRLAVAVRRWRAGATAGPVDGELVVALTSLIELVVKRASMTADVPDLGRDGA